MFRDRPEVAAIFSGTVVEVQTGTVVHVITFDETGFVTVTWGNNDHLQSRSARPTANGTFGGSSKEGFARGQRYVVIAHLLTETVRSTSTRLGHASDLEPSPGSSRYAARRRGLGGPDPASVDNDN